MNMGNEEKTRREPRAARRGGARAAAMCAAAALAPGGGLYGARALATDHAKARRLPRRDRRRWRPYRGGDAGAANGPANQGALIRTESSASDSGNGLAGGPVNELVTLLWRPARVGADQAAASPCLARLVAGMALGRRDPAD